MSGSAAQSHRPRLEPWRFLLRLALASAALLVLAHRYSEVAVNLLIPAIRAEIAALDDNLEIRSLDIAPFEGTTVVRLRANLVYPVHHRNLVVYPLGWQPDTEGWYEMRLNAKGALQSVVILLIALCAWPQRGLREWLLRLAIAVPLAALLFALDTPLDLLGNFQEAVIRGADPKAIVPLFAWDRFLEGGGGPALALGFAAAASALATRVEARLAWAPQKESAPCPPPP